MNNKTYDSVSETAIETFVRALLRAATNELRGVLVGDAESE